MKTTALAADQNNFVKPYVSIVRIEGVSTQVPAIEVAGREVVVTGRWLKQASIKDEAFVCGEIVPEPQRFLDTLRRWPAAPNLFTFSQKFTQPQPAHPFYYEWDNFAAIPITTYERWLKEQIKKDVKENIRRATREGVTVRAVPFDRTFIEGVKGIYDETPLRQGKPFWHHGKSVEELTELHGTYAVRAEFIGAFLNEELIGFIKMVYVDDYAKTMHVICKERHFSKRPVNLLLAKAVEICASRKLAHFVYGEYRFPGKPESSLSRFKQHHGFIERQYPRYYIPLTGYGKLALALRLHGDLRRHVPFWFTRSYLALRSRYYAHRRQPVGTGSMDGAKS